MRPCDPDGCDYDERDDVEFNGPWIPSMLIVPELSWQELGWDLEDLPGRVSLSPVSELRSGPPAVPGETGGNFQKEK